MSVINNGCIAESPFPTQVVLKKAFSVDGKYYDITIDVENSDAPIFENVQRCRQKIQEVASGIFDQLKQTSIVIWHKKDTTVLLDENNWVTQVSEDVREQLKVADAVSGLAQKILQPKQLDLDEETGLEEVSDFICDSEKILRNLLKSKTGLAEQTEHQIRDLFKQLKKLKNETLFSQCKTKREAIPSLEERVDAEMWPSQRKNHAEGEDSWLLENDEALSLCKEDPLSAKQWLIELPRDCRNAGQRLKEGGSSRVVRQFIRSTIDGLNRFLDVEGAQISFAGLDLVFQYAEALQFLNFLSHKKRLRRYEYNQIWLNHQLMWDMLQRTPQEPLSIAQPKQQVVNKASVILSLGGMDNAISALRRLLSKNKI